MRKEKSIKMNKFPDTQKRKQMRLSSTIFNAVVMVSVQMVVPLVSLVNNAQRVIYVQVEQYKPNQCAPFLRIPYYLGASRPSSESPCLKQSKHSMQSFYIMLCRGPSSDRPHRSCRDHYSSRVKLVLNLKPA